MPTRGNQLALLLWFAAAFFVWTGFRWQVLTLPPYFETAMGLFREADFLAETGFDYASLRRQPWVQAGGAYAYMTSIFPTIVALAMSTCATTTMMLTICHLIYIAAASGLVVLVFWIVRGFAGTGTAVACALAVATTPLLVVQTDIMGMDVPMTAAAVLAAWCVLKKQIAFGVLASMLAFACKPTGAVVTLALITFFAIRWLAHRLRDQPIEARSDLRGFLWALVALAIEIGIYTAGGVHERLRAMLFLGTYWRDFAYLCPDLVGVFTVCAGLTAWLVLRLLQKFEAHDRSLAARALRLIDSQPVLLLSWILVLGMLASFWLYGRVFVLRYLCLPVPFLYLIAANVFAQSRSIGQVAGPLFALMAGFNLLNGHGAFFPTLPRMQRQGGMLERSLEYLTDHRSKIAAIRKLNEAHRGEPVVAPHPFIDFLALPRLGYVPQPYHGYGIHPFLGAQFKPVTELFRDRPPELIFFSEDAQWSRMGIIEVPPIMPTDELIFDDRLPSPLRVFKKNLRGIKTPAEYDLWLVDNLWLHRQATHSVAAMARAGASPQADAAAAESIAGDPPVEAYALFRANQLEQSALAGPAALLLDRTLQLHPQLTEIRIKLGELLLQLGQTTAARQQLQIALKQLAAGGQVAQRARAHYYLGLASLKENDLNEAGIQIQQAIALAPSLAGAHFQLGLIRLNEKRFQDAATLLAQAAQRQPDSAAIYNYWGLAYFRLDQPDKALQSWRHAIALDPAFAESQLNLGIVLLNQKHLAEALPHLTRAVELSPQNAEAHFWRGVALLDQGTIEPGKAELLTALRIRPDYPEAKARLAQLHAKSS